MKGRISGGGYPAELDPAVIERMLREMNEAAAQGRGYGGDEAPFRGAQQTVIGSEQCGGRNVGREMERCPVCGRAPEGE